MKFLLFLAVSLLITDISLAMYHYNFNRRHISSPLQDYAPYLKISFVPLMAWIWHLISPSHSKWIYLYAFFAWGGDTFLLSKSFDVYKYGGVSFFLSHVMMIIYLNIKWSKVPLKAYFLMIPGIILITIYLIPQMVNPSLQSFCFISYALILVIGSCNAIARWSILKFSNPSFLCCVFGYWFYLISDSVLLKKEIVGASRNLDCEVMGTYFMAQILIFIGIAIDPLQNQQRQQQNADKEKKE
ncbi:hypothetical protein TRFO_04919 [Tritrichomonas foetus]|uniref:YhhN-like protein n=1 Tax=Tritrichomonas foetus TaxID=1144522 RepID=A0A1J4KBG0_9EUKA|nr:hypothetical protein TRFO_04919 [Tritrichomonas foetus]|eukprot:OHT08306.1 hypothetical protein TRFO_04919 [Tritrichomonas foetus]